MNMNQPNGRRTPRRYRRHSTKRRQIFRPPTHPGRLIAIIAAILAVIVLALVWGNALKRQSDAYRADQEAGKWTLPPDEDPTGENVAVPHIRAYEIAPEGNTGDIVIAGKHGGVLLPLRDADGSLHYLSDTANAAGVVFPSDAPSLEDDTARIQRRELHVTGIFHVTCLHEKTLSMQTYLRGLELSLLCEYAASGIDDILLVGLPFGTDEQDALSVAFLKEVKALLHSLESPPTIGVALPLSAFETISDEDGESLYAGNISPSRMALVADYSALDLRDKTAEEMDDLLPRLSYIYRRHTLRMMVSQADPTVAEDLISHGFDRVFEMK